MARFIKGDVVVVPFPFADLTGIKRRPALVIAELSGDDVILCQITSQNLNDIYAIPLNDLNFESGNLNRKSNIRPNRILPPIKKYYFIKSVISQKKRLQE